MPRPDLPLQLEHQTSLPLRRRLLPFLLALHHPSIRARHLGRHHPRRRRTPPLQHLHPPDCQGLQAQRQEVKESRRQALSSRRQPWHHQARQPEAQISDHRRQGQDCGAPERDADPALECAALCWSACVG